MASQLRWPGRLGLPRATGRGSNLSPAKSSRNHVRATGLANRLAPEEVGSREQRKVPRAYRFFLTDSPSAEGMKRFRLAQARAGGLNPRRNPLGECH